MITIKKLKEELNKFPEDSVCFAYEGEITGLVIENLWDCFGSQGVIYCSENTDDEGKETRLLGWEDD